MHARAGAFWVTDNGAWMGYMAVAFSTLSQGAATLSTQGPERRMNAWARRTPYQGQA